MACCNPNTCAHDSHGGAAHRPFHGVHRARRTPIASPARVLGIALLLLLSTTQGWAQQDEPQQAEHQAERQRAEQEQTEQPHVQQMRGLDEQVQEIKSDVLDISAELSLLEEKLLYPSGTQVSVFVALAKGDTLRLDAVRLRIDGKLVAHYIYSAKELEALRKGGVQRLYVGNVSTGNHELEVLVDGKLENGADFSHTDQFSFRKDVHPRLVGLTLAGPGSGKPPIRLGEW
jgi:hypothetical protein